ncbi:hypothetical protein ACFQ1Q_03525 [Winogradskyella litorisediminis]|uniref:Secreted protein n=1 Tax=Winogradskyella litorisediminis TaxID=1156618 RepID=A0ABW3N5U4_9FLAO
MKKTILTSVFTIVIALTSFAQGVYTIDTSSERLYMSSDASKAIDAYGTPYVDENFLPVRISGYDNQLFTGRYNANNGEMEINLGTKVIALDVSKGYEVMFTQNNKIYRTYNFSTPSGIAKRGFLNVVSSSDSYELLKQEIVKYYEKQPAATSYQQDKPAKFVEEDPNYYLKKGNVIKVFPTKKKDLLKAYPKDAKKIKGFMKENKISLKDEADLIKLSGFLATL